MEVFKCDAEVMDSEELNKRIAEKVKQAQIIDRFTDDETRKMNSDSIPMAVQNQMRRIRQRMVKLNNYWEIHEMPITSHRRYIGKMIVFAKKVYRKLTRWLVMPYLVQINRFHYDTICMIDEIIELQEMLIEMEERGEKKA